MLTNLTEAQQKYGGSNQVIDNWLAERRELLIKYCKIAGLPPYDKTTKSLPQLTDIIDFCEVLVDYLSAGHFEVFDQIASKCNVNGGESLKLARSLWPKINATTDIALSFNDKFADSSDVNWEQFDNHLSTLGQALEDRFDYEDQLIHELYSKHSEVA